MKRRLQQFAEAGESPRGWWLPTYLGAERIVSWSCCTDWGVKFGKVAKTHEG